MHADVDYWIVKLTHVAAVATSYSLFFVRGVWMVRGSALLQARWVRVVPHVVDTILLASAIALASMMQQYPLAAPWLTAKVVALVVYIVLGSIALKHGRTRRIRIAAWIAAQCVFGYIVWVAVSKDPFP